MSETQARRRTAGQVIVAALFALLAANAFQETFWSDSPMPLRVWQAVAGALAAATTWGAWTAARWSAALALVYGCAIPSERSESRNRARPDRGRALDIAPLHPRLRKAAFAEGAEN